MELKTKNSVNFIEVKQLYSKKNDSTFEIIAFGDPVSFQRFEYFKNDGINLPADLKAGDEVHLVVEVSKRGYNNNYNLVGVEKVGY